MSIRDQGLRKVAAVTTGLVAAGVVGSVGVAVAARAHTESDRSVTSTTSSTSDDDTSDGRSVWAPGSGGVSRGGDGLPHATSGGS